MEEFGDSSEEDSLAYDFENWMEEFEECISRAINKIPAAEKYNESLMKEILEHIIGNGTVSPIIDPIVEQKSRKISVELRTKGQMFHSMAIRKPRVGYWDKAFNEYTKSVLYAPPGSEELAIAYENRSALLCDIKLFSDSLLDIERALQNDCPDHLRAELYLRKAKCLKILEPESQDAIAEAFADAQEWKDSIDGAEIYKFEKRLMEEERSTSFYEKPFSKWDYERFEPELTSKNKAVPGLSDAVRLKYSVKFGRHIIAARNIKPGEVLAVEAPIAKLFDPEIRCRFCSHCSKQAWASVPCDDCVEVVYCSELCRDTAKSLYHELECPVFQSLRVFGVPESVFIFPRFAIEALREARGSLRTLKENLLKVDLETDPLLKGLKNGIFLSTEFSSAYSLTHNPPLEREKLGVFSNPILIAYFFATKTNFFGERLFPSLNILKDDWNFICLAGMIQKMMLVYSSNRIDITLEGNRVECLFHGLFPAVSFFNHSCNPTVTRSVQRDKIVITAIQPRKKGEQLFLNYGPHYKMCPREERQMRIMRGYHFICGCKPCKFNWPMTYGKPVTFNTRNNNQSFAKIMKELSQVRKNFMIAQFCLMYFGAQNHEIPDVSRSIEAAAKLIIKTYIKYGKNSKELLASVVYLERFVRGWSSPNVSLN